MLKDAYYFSHDSNAHQDPKIMKLFMELKAEGYGIYWVIIEMLRNEASLYLNKSDYDAIAYQSHSDRIKVARVVEEFNLFTLDENGSFCSQSLINRVEIYREKSKKYSDNARKRWDKHAMAMQSHSNGNALKERKGKEIKETIKKEASVTSSKKEELFLSIWNKYPNKQGKKAAQRHFLASVKSEEDFENIKKALKNYIEFTKTIDQKYIKNGSTWFNDWECWVNREKKEGIELL